MAMGTLNGAMGTPNETMRTPNETMGTPNGTMGTPTGITGTPNGAMGHPMGPWGHPMRPWGHPMGPWGHVAPRGRAPLTLTARVLVHVRHADVTALTAHGRETAPRRRHRADIQPQRTAGRRGGQRGGAMETWGHQDGVGTLRGHHGDTEGILWGCDVERWGRPDIVGVPRGHRGGVVGTSWGHRGDTEGT